MNALTPQELELLHAQAWEIFDGPECPQAVRDAIEWYHSSILELAQRTEQQAGAAALQPSASAEPVQGWKLVPADATNEMCIAGMKRMFEDRGYSAAWEDVFFNCYRAMLSASPPPVTAAREQEAGATGAAIAALRYWRDECSGAEPSISVFERMVDEALATPTTYRVRDEALDCLTMIRDWPVDQWQDWQLATRTMAAMARKALERAAEEQIE